MVEVFKTNVRHDHDAHILSELIGKRFPGSKVNFDLEDCDRILRIDCENFAVERIILLMNENGFSCHTLE